MMFELPKKNTKVYYYNGIVKSIGNIEEFFVVFYFFRIGLWIEFYKKKLKEFIYWDKTLIKRSCEYVSKTKFGFVIDEWKIHNKKD